MIKSKFSAKLLKAMDQAELRHVQAKVEIKSSEVAPQNSFGIAGLLSINPLVLEQKLRDETNFIVKVKNSVTELEDLSDFKGVVHLS